MPKPRYKPPSFQSTNDAMPADAVGTPGVTRKGDGQGRAL